MRQSVECFAFSPALLEISAEAHAIVKALRPSARICLINVLSRFSQHVSEFRSGALKLSASQ